MRHLLIDGDVLVYASSFGAQRTRYTLHVEGEEPRGFPNAKACKAFVDERGLQPEQYERTSHLDVLDEAAATACCKNMLASVVEAIEPDKYTIFLTGKERPNFREAIATIKPYKGNRVQEKPVHFGLALEYFQNRRETVVAEGQEADDLIGIWATHHGGNGVVASIDKDLRQIHGRHYEWHNTTKFTINPDDSDRWFWLQMLMGDTADNIPGIKGVGDKTAAKMLDGITDRQARADVVIAKYAEQYGDKAEDAMREVGQLLWIRRDYDQMWNLHDYLNNNLTEA